MGGRVTYSDTGEPVELGTVAFSSPTRQSRGEIKEDGKYVIGTFGDKDGLPRGEYSVTVFAVKSVVEDADGRISDSIAPPPVLERGAKDTMQRQRSINLIDPKYQKAATSGLKFVVDGKTKTFDIQVDRASDKAKNRK
ncbi:hypothetical protein FACS1894189_3030 [Planctomycetales bacterium]|nr:hypothetical protein FACS1894189_3030 [Planctomycetales bacterium]